MTLERPAALKILAGELARDVSVRDRFIRESRLAASLDHPHIVPVYDAGESDGSFYLVMRLIEGRDLKKVIRSESPLEPLRVAALLADVADALDAAHEAGLVHRDVKPENVLVGAGRGGGERPYLTDFGLTKRRDGASALTATGTMLGTIDYIAPEQVQGEDTDLRADVYALGCVAYECLTGRPPFAKDSEMSTLYAHVHDQAAPSGSLRAGLPPKSTLCSHGPWPKTGSAATRAAVSSSKPFALRSTTNAGLPPWWAPSPSAPPSGPSPGLLRPPPGPHLHPRLQLRPLPGARLRGRRAGAPGCEQAQPGRRRRGRSSLATGCPGVVVEQGTKLRGAARR